MVGDPIYYLDLITSKNKKIEIKGQFEICQGGPSIGDLFVDGQCAIPGSQFGGPMLEFNNALFIPKRSKGWFFNGFKLMRIDLNSFEMRYLGIKSDLLFLKRIDNNYLYFSKVVENLCTILGYTTGYFFIFLINSFQFLSHSFVLFHILYFFIVKIFYFILSIYLVFLILFVFHIFE